MAEFADVAALALTVEDARRAIDTGAGWVEDEHGCWISRARASSGAGPFLSFFLAAHGPVPDGLRVVHECGRARSGCVAPHHLTLVDEHLPAPLPSSPRADAGSFAARLRDERDARDCTVADLAAELGVAASTARSWLSGRPPTVNETDAVARRLGWDGRPRRFTVTAVVQRVVVARSAGEAARRARADLERPDQPGKVRVARVT